MKSYTIREALAYLQDKNFIFSEKTLRRYIDKGLIESSKDGYRIHMAEEALDNYILSQKYNRVNDKAQILTFANHKGGVGKTVSVFNVAGALEELKHKVLVVDIDPQASLSEAYNIRVEQVPSMFNVLTENNTINEAIISINSYIDILPAFRDLSLFERAPLEHPLKLDKLSGLLNELRVEYDYILIDCPPQLSILASCGIIASDYLFIPIIPDFFSLSGLMSFIEYAKEEKNNVNIAGIFFTRYNKRRSIDKEVMPELADYFKDNLLKTTIRESTKVSQSVFDKRSIIFTEPHTSVANDYRELTKEVKRRTRNE